jgi:hypothetical protein
MRKVTPIHPGTDSPEPAPINVIETHLAQAMAIVELVAIVDREGLREDTVGCALQSAMEHIEAAREAVANALDKQRRESHNTT